MWLPFAWLISLGGCFGLVQATSNMGGPPFVSRKLCHLGAGTVFAMTWPLYSDNIVSGIVASSVVWLSAAKFLLVGLKVIHDPNFASSMGAASGQEHILLQGPVQYGTVIATLTMTHFKSPFSIVPIGVLCGGDAMAALFGSRYGEQRLPWNKNKTIVGTAAFIAGAFSVSSGLLLYMDVWDKQDVDWLSRRTALQTLAASVLGAVAETAPPLPHFGNLDNLLIPASTMLVMTTI